MTVVTPKVRYRRTFIYAAAIVGATMVVLLNVVGGLMEGLSIPQALVYGVQHAWLIIAAAVLTCFVLWGFICSHRRALDSQGPRRR